MVVLYTLTMFVGATLLFIVQPMVAKLLLPSLGGSAAVWTTCMLFFQAVLLAGYGYAHLGARWLAPRQLVLVHATLMLAAAIALPFTIPTLEIDPSASPTAWLLAALLLSIGLPFFVVSATAPLLQHFFAQTEHEHATDPYFLYAASNLGSMVALLGYPAVVEPSLGVEAQTVGWAAVYAVFVLLMTAAARTVFGRRDRPGAVATETNVSWRQRGRWVLLAAVPSSLMLGVTQHITTDLAPVPLLWVLPLALYLGTFVLVFARRAVMLPDRARTAVPILALLIFAVVRQIGGPIGVALHLANFALFALFFHGLLARERPGASRLTEYFLALSVGGALGGVFNALAAPLLFDRLIEYWVVLFAAIACIAPETREPRGRRVLAVLTGLAACTYLWSNGLVTSIQWYLFGVYFAVVAVPAGLWPRWRNVVIAAVLTAGTWVQLSDRALVHDRSFFAAYTVYDREHDTGEFRYLRHGTTLHGVQALDPQAARIARSYHHPDGPVGEVFATIEHESVLVVGLGVGAMAAYAKHGTRFEFYEIDPLVAELATDWFTYLSSCGDGCSVAIGDGRRLLAESDARYDIIVLDAYNSSGVPTHLLTREALQLYLRHLEDDGVLLFNVSNRYIEVAEVVGTLCADAGLTAYERSFDPPWKRAYEELIDASQFIVAAPDATVLESFAGQPEVWKSPPTMKTVWTDDFTNLIDVVRW